MKTRKEFYFDWKLMNVEKNMKNYFDHDNFVSHLFFEIFIMLRGDVMNDFVSFVQFIRATRCEFIPQKKNFVIARLEF